MIEYRVYKVDPITNKPELLDNFERQAQCFQYLQKMVNNSDDDFAHEDYYAAKYILEETTNEWLFDESFDRKYLGAKTAKGLFYTREQWNNENK